jgi:Transposase/Protein of unknown function (DUF1670)
VMLKTTPTTIGKYIAQWEAANGRLLPRRGTIHDMGPTLNRLDDIVNYFTHPITNGPQEGMNSKLMSVIRAGRGYRHHETFRMAALFFLSGLDMAPRHRHG